MMRSIIKSNKTYYVLGILFLFVVWGIGALSIKNDYVVPSVGATFTSLFDLFIQGHTYIVLLNTLLRLFISVGACSILGIVLAILSNASVRFKSFLKPIMVLSKTLPIAVVIVLLLVMLEAKSVYYITGVVVLPIIYEAFLSGFENIDINIINELRVNTKDNAMVYRKVYIPLAFPNIITGFIQAIGLGLKVLVMAEYLAHPRNSIGYEIMYYKDLANEMSYVYAWSLILITFVLCVELILNIVKRKLGLHEK